MEDKGPDIDSLALMALADPTATVGETARSHRNQLGLGDTSLNSLSDTGMLRALRREGVSSLDDLRRLSEQIRKDRQPKSPSKATK